MSTVTVSSKFQVVIPAKIQQSIHIKPGQKMHVIAFDGLVTLIPVRPIKESRGSLKTINTIVERDKGDRV